MDFIMLRINTVLNQFKKHLGYGEGITNYYPYISTELERDELSECIDSFCEIIAWENYSDFSDLESFLNDDYRYFTDKLSERADSMVEIYNYKLRQWSVSNYEWIEEAVSEFGVESKNFDYHKLIQLAQYLMYLRGLNDVNEAFKTFISEKYKF